MLLYRQGEPLTDEELERRLRWVDVDCVDPDSIDQGELLAFSQGPVSAERAQSIHAHLERCSYCQQLADEYRRISLERRKKWRGFAALGGGLAAAAVLAVLFFGPPQEQLAEFGPLSVHGRIADTMAAPETSPALPPQPWRFASTSEIELILAPKREQKSAKPVVSVYSAIPGGELVRSEGVAVSIDDQPEYPVLRINSKGKAMFGDKAGPRTLVVVLSPKTSKVPDLSGAQIDSALRGLPKEAQTFTFDVLYELAN